MKRIKVELGKKSYNILIGSDIVHTLPVELKKINPGKVAIIVTNSTILTLYGSALKRKLKSFSRVHTLTVPDSEKSKSFSQCIKLIKKFAYLDRGEGIFVIAFGGGVIGDLAGFCASIYRRGVAYIQIPTTLLAQVDSSIGGKVAIDLACGKNLAGSFYQPQLVLSDVELLASLSTKQIKIALAEIIKYGIIADSKFFVYLETHLEKILKLKQKELTHVVEVCSKIKAGIVAQDEYDKKGKRIILNFGHTVGHALETAFAYSKTYSHGHAISLGMLIACEISLRLRLIKPETFDRLESLLRRVGLPTKIKKCKVHDILKALKYDKKFEHGKNRFVLPLRIGKVIVRKNVPEYIIKSAIIARLAR